VMRDGVMQQADTPQNLYRNPTNLFVAAFIGSPSMNLVEAEIEDGIASFGGLRIALDGEPPVTGKVILGIRPQSFEDAAFADPSLPTMDVEATVVEELGSESHVIFAIDAPPVDVESVLAASDEGERAMLIADDRRSLFTAEVSEASKVRPGQRIRLALDPSRFHYFDIQSGTALAAESLAAA
jgi:multiple sugar transport system ATP-binding protein